MYFLGIGGIGMSALARFFLAVGKTVYGYDRMHTALVKDLISEGAHIHFSENTELIPKDIDLVIYTPAIQKSNIEFQFFLKQKCKISKRSEVLGLITKDHFTVAVAGTHGKTTITSIIAHILKTNNSKITAFIGGISKNYSSNLINTPDTEIFIVEADEYDRSFLALEPDIAVISSIDADHLDIYGSRDHLNESFQTFVSQIKAGGNLISRKGIKIFEESTINKLVYAINDTDTDYFASNLKVDGSFYIFDLSLNGLQINNIKSNIPGRHNIENCVAAAAVSHLFGVKPGIIKEALESYSGVERRFDIRINTGEFIYIDDYAHHPEEIKAVINSVRELFPGKKITGVFQPHLFTRTRDFANGFAQSLALIDEVILLDIYPAREAPIDGINSTMLLNKIDKKQKNLFSKDELLIKIKDLDTDILISLGAGDIDQLVKPIEQILLKKYNKKIS